MQRQMKRQTRILTWAVGTFGDIAKDRIERASRLIEEAIEVAQAEGMRPAEIKHLVDVVYSKPSGELHQEIGGCALTLEALAENVGLDVEAEADREMQRVEMLPRSHFAAKQAIKIEQGISR